MGDWIKYMLLHIEMLLWVLYGQRKVWVLQNYLDIPIGVYTSDKKAKEAAEFMDLTAYMIVKRDLV